MSPLAQGQAQYVTEDNLDALVISPAQLGGWHADLILKRVPPGVPNTIGSPVASPYRTYNEAERHAKTLLVTALMMGAKADPSRPPAFLFYGFAIPLHAKIYEETLAKMPPGYRGYGSPEAAIARLDEVMDQIAPGRPADVDFNAWDHERKLRVVAILYGAALSGLFAYPPRRDASPSGHSAAETSEARH
jgi:hypothetical protein